jgi:hypothetical protein
MYMVITILAEGRCSVLDVAPICMRLSRCIILTPLVYCGSSGRGEILFSFLTANVPYRWMWRSTFYAAAYLRRGPGASLLYEQTRFDITRLARVWCVLPMIVTMPSAATLDFISAILPVYHHRVPDDS